MIEPEPQGPYARTTLVDPRYSGETPNSSDRCSGLSLAVLHLLGSGYVLVSY